MTSTATLRAAAWLGCTKAESFVRFGLPFYSDSPSVQSLGRGLCARFLRVTGKPFLRRQAIKPLIANQITTGPTMAVPMVPARDAFARTLAEIRMNSNNPRVLDATYQLEVFSAAIWPNDQDGIAHLDRWRAYKLTQMECRIMDCLVARMGKPVTKAMLMNFCYFDRPSEPDQKIIDVKVCHIRKRIKNSPYRIETVWGFGYRMELKAT